MLNEGMGQVAQTIVCDERYRAVRALESSMINIVEPVVDYL